MVTADRYPVGERGNHCLAEPTAVLLDALMEASD
jgi:hypothetical protein